MATEQCSNCKFYSDDQTQVRIFGGILPGICRHEPPVTAFNETVVKPLFPACRPDTWCGRWTEIGA